MKNEKYMLPFMSKRYAPMVGLLYDSGQTKKVNSNLKSQFNCPKYN